MKNNIGEAILILGTIYLFTILNGWTKWFLLIPSGLAFYTWSHYTNTKEVLENLKLNNTKLKLEIELMKAQTSFYIAQGAAIMRGLKR